MSYPGGKGSSYQQLINQIPPHDTYIEMFLGGGAVMRNKRPSRLDVGIDLDGAAVQAMAGELLRWGDLLVGDGLEYVQVLAHNGKLTAKDFIYADPPYLMETRKGKRPLYKHEFSTPEEHNKLLDVLTSLPCMVMLSGYWSELYGRRLANWRSFSFQAQTRSGATATEWVWMNYPEPVRLHDYRYLGEDFRERERVKRKAKRWVAGLRRLPVLEQRAVLAAMQEGGLIE